MRDRDSDEPDRYDDEDDRPHRRRRFGDEDDFDDRPRRRKPASGGGLSVGAIVGIVAGVLVVVGGGLAVLLYFSVSKVRDAAGRAKDQNNLKTLGLGFHNSHDATNAFPGYEFRDPQTGKTTAGLSGRVNLLPYIEYDALYRRFDLTQPWDAPANRSLADTPVQCFTSPLDPKDTSATRYRGFAGPGTMFEPGKSVRITEITDGTANTILYITADDGVPWSKPAELPYDPNGPLPSFGKKGFPGGTNALMADGSVRFLKNGTPEATVRLLITRNDGMAVPDW